MELYGIVFVQCLFMYGGKGKRVLNVGLAVILLQVISVAKDDICMYQNTIVPHPDQNQNKFFHPA